ncbi:NAD(P)/FAD-dependent oxidoreductase [Caballeronia mineralivorans]|jgi:thioredoxin reductase (NADPH)|uniref:NAD(P)/FAD-dependent oxidoreductase n=1 Tax=Caballeronia mineralivorans TaxID=2010198 RepID=UPI002AFDDCEB|nr:NAD(P)/FAD-dependent oxidoreductase [Caballeronia mineralivorans]MEA3104530.1 thioredoxin reductase [Caballeronia mineralivorans]
MSAQTEVKTDVLIVGAGPVGIFTAFECGMAGLKSHLIDALPHPGGQCVALYPEKPIFDIPALPRITGGALIEQLLTQARPFEPVFHCSAHIVEMDRRDDRWYVVMSSGVKIVCGAIIVASGAGLLRPNKPDWPGLDRFEGCGVHYGVTHKDRFENRSVVIAGGGDSAVDWAVELAPITRSLTLIHRRERFRAAPETLRQMHELVDTGRIEIVAPAKVLGLGGSDQQLQHVEVQVGTSPRIIDCDDMLLFFGLATDASAYHEWGLRIDGTQVVVEPATCATNLAAVFAVGDVATYPGKLKLILTGFSEAAIAAREAYRLCNPNEEIFTEYSTARGVPVTH